MAAWQPNHRSVLTSAALVAASAALPGAAAAQATRAPKAVKARLDALGLGLCSSHAPFPAGSEATAILDQQAELGAKTLVWSLEPEEFTSVDAIRRGAARINEAVHNAAAYGMRIGYHNHFAEFRTKFNGRSAYRILLNELDPSVVIELDTYWAQTGGVDPAAVAASLGKRLEYIHIKDGPALGMDDYMVSYGQGVIDVDRVVQANPAVRWNIVEMDRSHYEMYGLLRQCYDYLVGRGLATGKRTLPRADFQPRWSFAPLTRSM